MKPAILFSTALTLMITIASGLSAADKGGPFISGADPVVLGRGGTGVSCTGADQFLLNPASVSQIERLSFSASYGSLDGDYTFPYISLLMPGPYGVVGLAAGYFSGTVDETSSTGYSYHGTVKGDNIRISFRHIPERGLL